MLQVINRLSILLNGLKIKYNNYIKIKKSPVFIQLHKIISIIYTGILKGKSGHGTK